MRLDTERGSYVCEDADQRVVGLDQSEVRDPLTLTALQLALVDQTTSLCSTVVLATQQERPLRLAWR